MEGFLDFWSFHDFWQLLKLNYSFYSQFKCGFNSYIVVIYIQIENIQGYIW